MRRRKRVRQLAVVLAILAAIAAVLATCTSEQGATEVTDFGTNPGELRMLKWVPARAPSPAPLVVVLHGCAQGAAAYAVDSGWQALAETHGVLLLLPEQRRRNNFNRCFNWFRPEDNRRGVGEASSVRQMIDRMAADHSVGPVFVTGVSAGGAMSNALLASYPEVFSGGGILAGVPYGCAGGIMEAIGCMLGPEVRDAKAWGQLVRQASSHGGPWPRVSVWQGGSDRLVDPANAQAIIAQWTDVHGVDRAAATDARIGGHRHSVYNDSQGKAVVEIYTVSGMGHGVPVDPDSSEHPCGHEGFFFHDANICSSARIARFWGLFGSRSNSGQR